MSDDNYGYQRIEDRPINVVNVYIGVESGCDPKDGEYGMRIHGFCGSLDIDSPGGVDDISLIKEAIANHDSFDFPEEGHLDVVLKESGEWEDVFWHKYYVVDRVVRIDY